MAITNNTYTGNGTNKLFSITFPYLDTSDIDVYLNGTLQTITTQYTFANATTIEFVAAPANGATIKLDRSTADSDVSSTFFPGSSIKAADLNENFDQTLYLTQEINNNAVKLADPLYANKTYIDAQDATKVTKAGDSMSGALAMGTNKITGLGNPTSAQDATTKTYTDAADALKVTKAGDTMSGNLAMAGNKVTGLGTTSASTDAATKQYVDDNALLYSGSPGFTQDGTGAVTRSWSSKLKDVVSVNDFASLAQAYTYAAANGKKVALNEGQTVRVPTDCATLQIALDHSQLTNQATIQFATGYVLTSGAVLENGDWSAFTLTSVDASVSLGSGFGVEEDIIYAANAQCPRIATSFNGLNTYGRNGFYLQNSTIYVNASCGVTQIAGTGTGTNTSGVIGGGIVLVRSTAYCRQSTFTNNDDINVFCTQGSQVYGDFGTYTGAKGDANVYIGRGSTGSVSYASMNNATTGTGLRVRRSICVALACTATGNAGYGILAEEGAYVVANDQSTTPSNFSSNTVAALKVANASMLDARGCSATSVPKALIIEGGSTADLSDCSATTTNTTIELLDSTVVINNSTLSSSTRGVLCTRSVLTGTDVSITTSANEAIYALNGSTLSLPNLTLSGGVRGLRLVGSVKAECPNCSITGWSTTGVDISNLSTANLYQGTVAQAALTGCIALTRGCTVLASNCTTSNSSGTPLLSDTNVSAFNVLSTSARGIVYV